MKYQGFSKRQILAMTWWNRPNLQKYDGILCSGAVRSGKTVCLADGFFLWSMANFNGCAFGICGKTVSALRRNVIAQLSTWLGGILEIREHYSQSKLTVRNGAGHENTYYLFGGENESSYKQIQGVTLAGVLLDEVALMPRSFVEQALARCSVKGSKLWFSCNPEGPEHWFYKEWIQKSTEKNVLVLHFTMADNPGLDPGVRERYERMYTGVFYKRYILGQWCMAEGLIYDFQREKHITEDIPDRGRYYISVDYGTLNPFSAGLWCVTGDRAVRVKEYYYSGRDSQCSRTDEEYYTALRELAEGYPVEQVIIDPSAASFIATIRRHGEFSVRKAVNAVLPGIHFVASLLHCGALQFAPECRDTIREFGLYRWETEGEQDRPCKENDHAMDDVRYFCATVLRRNRDIMNRIGGNGYEKMVDR